MGDAGARGQQGWEAGVGVVGGGLGLEGTREGFEDSECFLCWGRGALSGQV